MVDKDYEPGEPYEFMHTYQFTDVTVLSYRCFRGQCAVYNRPHYVSDRNTHNQYHNGRGE